MLIVKGFVVESVTAGNGCVVTAATYDHDVCCEIHRYFSSECLSVPECDEPYNCTLLTS